jgi:hypothetical protein
VNNNQGCFKLKRPQLRLINLKPSPISEAQEVCRLIEKMLDGAFQSLKGHSQNCCRMLALDD